MAFFDFHCHPGLKPQFANPDSAPSPWDKITVTLQVPIIKSIGVNVFFNEILNSQCCLSQLSKDVKLIGLVLHAPESNMGRGLAERKIIQDGLVKPIDFTRVQYIAEGTHYYALIKQELARLQNALTHDGATLTIIQHAAEYDEQKPDTIFAVLSVEGLHCFFSDPNAADAKQQFDNNFEEFVSAHTILAINVCHLQQNPFCNHAHGIQFFKDDYFYPTGDGFTDWGRQMVEKLKEKNILIDIKHTSLKSRRQLYEMMKDADGNYTQPIVCTHAGLTGLSIRDRVKYLCERPSNLGQVYQVMYYKPRSPLLRDTYFNCSSINLYDEDIEEVLLSGGLIGLSFDQRIIGFANENVLRDATFPHEAEFISNKEAAFFLGPFPEALPVYKGDDIWLAEDFENLDPSLDEILHFTFFCNQALHILSVAKQIGIAVTKAAKQICLGTDFDGLINAIDNCKTADDLASFRQHAISKLPSLLNKAKLENEGLDVNEFVEDLFYRNGRDFVLRRLS